MVKIRYSRIRDKYRIKCLLVCLPKGKRGRPLGYTAPGISKKLKIPLYRVRYALRELCIMSGPVHRYKGIYSKKLFDPALTSVALKYHNPPGLFAEKIFPVARKKSDKYYTFIKKSA